MASITRVFILLLVLAMGIYVGGHPTMLPGPLRDLLVSEEAATQAEAIEVIERNYFEPVNGNKLTNRSLRGLIGGLGDRFSVYLDPTHLKLYEQQISGRYSGIGVSVRTDRRGLRVTRVYKGSPAQRVGVKRSDVITAVDGRPIANRLIEAITTQIKGPSGTKVRITVSRSDGQDKTYRIKREKIDLPLTETSIKITGRRRIGVIELAEFAEGAHADLAEALRTVRKRGAEGVVLDLRGNPGGLLDEAVSVTGLFLEPGKVVVTTRGRHRPQTVYRSKGKPVAAKVPLVVLVDRSSASASEIVAAALKEQDRAKVVGKRTFGKGVFQALFPLRNGGAVDLTVGHYYTPDGHDLGGKGVKPDVVAQDRAKSSRDEALQVAIQQSKDR